MRRSILMILPAVAIVALTGCIVSPPPLVTPDPTPDVTTQPDPTPDVPQPDPEPAAQTAEAPEVRDNVGPITPGGEEGSPGNPFPAGADLTGGDWSVALFAANLDAEAAVVAGGGLPAPEGWLWISAVVQVETSGTESSTADVWASYVAPNGDLYFSVIDTSIPGSNPVEDMAPGQQYEFTEYLLAPEATVAQGVMAITTAGLTSFIALQ